MLATPGIRFVQTSVLTMLISVILTEYRKLAACDDEQGIVEGSLLEHERAPP